MIWPFSKKNKQENYKWMELVATLQDAPADATHFIRVYMGPGVFRNIYLKEVDGILFTAHSHSKHPAFGKPVKWEEAREVWRRNLCTQAMPIRNSLNKQNPA